MKSNSIRIIAATVIIIMAIAMYISVCIIVGLSLSEMIPPWQTILSIIVLFSIIAISAHYISDQRKKTVLVIGSIMIIMFFFLFYFFWKDGFLYWFAPTLVITETVVSAIAYFWPESNKSNRM